jgi:hypothetical protein
VNSLRDIPLQVLAHRSTSDQTSFANFRNDDYSLLKQKAKQVQSQAAVSGRPFDTFTLVPALSSQTQPLLGGQVPRFLRNPALSLWTLEENHMRRFDKFSQTLLKSARFGRTSLAQHRGSDTSQEPLSTRHSGFQRPTFRLELRGPWWRPRPARNRQTQSSSGSGSASTGRTSQSGARGPGWWSQWGRS